MANNKINTPSAPLGNNPQPSAPVVDPNQKVETNAYVPTYRIKPEFKKAVLQAIGDRPFNEIGGLINAIDVEVMDHQTLTQIVNAIGQFPYVRVENLMKNISNYVQQVIEDD
jgi:hypothetical protein